VGECASTWTWPPDVLGFEMNLPTWKVIVLELSSSIPSYLLCCLTRIILCSLPEENSQTCRWPGGQAQNCIGGTRGGSCQDHHRGRKAGRGEVPHGILRSVHMLKTWHSQHLLRQ
jgi:hypothetical protein